MIISLIGYMGSGKTTTGKNLAKAINYKFIDLDKHIEYKYKQKISEIFQNEGELIFRKKERETLKEILDNSSSLVLSLGGGTPAYYDNMNEIINKSISIFLRVQLTYLVKRLQKKKMTRPLIAHLSDEQMTDFIAKHLFERNQFYEKSKLTINITDQNPDQIVMEIINQLNDLNILF